MNPNMMLLAFAKITEGEFPFVLEYEMNGQRYLIEDTVVCTWEGYDMSNNFAIFGRPYSRMWNALLNSGDKAKKYLLSLNRIRNLCLLKEELTLKQE